MNEKVIAFLIGIGIAAIIIICIFRVIRFFSGGNTQMQSSGSGSVQIQSGGRGSVSISNNNGHVKIKGRVSSVSVNGRKIYD